MNRRLALLAGVACTLALAAQPRAVSPHLPAQGARAAQVPDVNLALHARAVQSSLAYSGAPERAVDGDTDGDFMHGSVTHTDIEPGAWWEVDLGADRHIDRIVIWNRTDCCSERLAGITVAVSSGRLANASPPPGAWTRSLARAERRVELPVDRTGRYVRVQLDGRNYLSLAEVEVFGRASGVPPTKAVPGLTSTDAATTVVQPSTAPRTVSFEDLVKVTVPGGLLRAPTPLTISPLRDVPGGAWTVTRVPAYDITLGDMRELAQPITIEFAYSDARTSPNQSRDTDVVALRWDAEAGGLVALPTTVDAARHIATATTTHLCPFLLARADVFEPYHARLVQVDTVTQMALGALSGGPEDQAGSPAFDSLLVTSNFSHRYRRAEVNVLGRTWVIPAVWTGRNIPLFIDAAGQYLETALASYAPATGALTVPLGPPITVVYRRLGTLIDDPPPARYVHDLNRIEVDTSGSDPKNEPRRYRRRYAHELFHVIQNRWLGGGQKGGRKASEPTIGRALTAYPHGYWWMEASAEAAACRIAWNLPHDISGSVEDIYPYLLEYALSREGLPDNTHAMPAKDFEPWVTASKLEYQRGYLPSYLIDHGADFFQMNAAVLNRYRDDAEPLAIFAALNQYLLTSPAAKGLPELYRQFAAWFLLSTDSPLGASARTRREPLQSVVKTTQGDERAADPLPLGGPSNRRPIEQSFMLAAKYSAHMWAVRANTTEAKVPIRRVRVTAVELATLGSTIAQLFVADGDQRLPNDPVPIATLDRRLARTELDMSNGKTLYVIVTNTSETDLGRATIRVEDITPDPSIPPSRPATAPRPSTTAPPGASSKGSTGHWKLIGTRSTKYQPSTADTSIVSQSFDVAEGTIGGHVTSDSHTGEGPATWAGSCTWTWRSARGLETLIPGDTIDVSMTITDESVPEKVSGWNHGHTGVSGGIRFEMPYIPLGVSHQAAVDLVNLGAGWKESTPQQATWKVPAGPGNPEWGGRASLEAHCGFGKFERVYEWTTGPM